MSELTQIRFNSEKNKKQVEDYYPYSDTYQKVKHINKWIIGFLVSIPIAVAVAIYGYIKYSFNGETTTVCVSVYAGLVLLLSFTTTAEVNLDTKPRYYSETLDKVNVNELNTILEYKIVSPASKNVAELVDNGFYIEEGGETLYCRLFPASTTDNNLYNVKIQLGSTWIDPKAYASQLA